eukprot:3064651-Rhodomonas_salina.2
MFLHASFCVLLGCAIVFVRTQTSKLCQVRKKWVLFKVFCHTNQTPTHDILRALPTRRDVRIDWPRNSHHDEWHHEFLAIATTRVPVALPGVVPWYTVYRYGVVVNGPGPRYAYPGTRVLGYPGMPFKFDHDPDPDLCQWLSAGNH